MRTQTDMSLDPGPPDDTSTEELYKMGFHFMPYRGSHSGKKFFLPQMTGYGENQVILFPNGLISIRMAKGAELPPHENVNVPGAGTTAQAVDRLAPFYFHDERLPRTGTGRLRRAECGRSARAAAA